MIIAFLEQPVPYLAFALALAIFTIVTYRQGRRIKRLEERTNLQGQSILASTVARIQRPTSARSRRRTAKRSRRTA